MEWAAALSQIAAARVISRMWKAARDLVRQYALALGEEPPFRAFAVASFVDVVAFEAAS